MPDLEIVWEPPPRRQRPSQFDTALEAVRDKPGEWARLRLYKSSAAAYGARRRLTSNHSTHDERWEFAVARVEDEYGLWARHRTEEQMKEPPA